MVVVVVQPLRERFAAFGFGETWKRSAARRSAQPSSTTQRASRRRPVSVSGALRYGMRAFRVGGTSQSTPNPEGPHSFKIPRP